MKRFLEARVAIKRFVQSKKPFVILCTFIRPREILGLSDGYDNRAESIFGFLTQDAH